MTKSEWNGLRRGMKMKAEFLVDKNVFEIVGWDVIHEDFDMGGYSIVTSRNIYYVFNPNIPYVKTASTIGAWSKLS